MNDPIREIFKKIERIWCLSMDKFDCEQCVKSNPDKYKPAKIDPCEIYKAEQSLKKLFGEKLDDMIPNESANPFTYNRDAYDGWTNLRDKLLIYKHKIKKELGIE